MATTPNDYATLEQVKEQLDAGGAAVSSVHDDFLNTLITRASRLIDQLIRASPGYFKITVAETRYFTGTGQTQLFLPQFCEAPTSVAVAETGDIDDASGTGGVYTAWATSDYLLWPYNADQLGRPWNALEIDVLNGNKVFWYTFPKCIKITAKWGYSAAVPDTILQATLIQVVRWFKRAQQGFADAGASPDMSSLKFVKKLDTDVALGLDGYHLPGIYSGN